MKERKEREEKDGEKGKMVLGNFLKKERNTKRDWNAIKR